MYSADAAVDSLQFDVLQPRLFECLGQFLLVPPIHAHLLHHRSDNVDDILQGLGLVWLVGRHVQFHSLQPSARRQRFYQKSDHNAPHEWRETRNLTRKICHGLFDAGFTRAVKYVADMGHVEVALEVVRGWIADVLGYVANVALS